MRHRTVHGYMDVDYDVVWRGFERIRQEIDLKGSC